jgi:hypothetical protein
VLLEEMDRKRLYVLLGFKSLRRYCYLGLNFTRRQSQSIETAVREYRIAVNIGQTPHTPYPLDEASERAVKLKGRRRLRDP